MMMRRVLQSATQAVNVVAFANNSRLAITAVRALAIPLHNSVGFRQYATIKKKSVKKSTKKAIVEPEAEEDIPSISAKQTQNNEMKAYELLAQAHKAIEEQKFDKAIDIGKQLLEMSFSGGFEVIALALYHSGDLEAAQAVLVEATEVAPTAWVFHQLLGNILAEREQYDEAYKAYEKALPMQGSDKSFIRYNYAVALGNANQFLRSYEQLLLVQSVPNELQNDILRRKVACLFQLEKFTEAGELIAKNIKAIKQRMLQTRNAEQGAVEDGEAEETEQQQQQQSAVDDSDPANYEADDRFDLSFFYSHLADSLRLCGSLSGKHQLPVMYQCLSEADRSKLVLDACYKALRFDKWNPLALHIILELSAPSQPLTDESRLYSVVIGLANNAGKVLPSSLTKYNVVADSPTEALSFIRPFEGIKNNNSNNNSSSNTVKLVAQQIQLNNEKPKAVEQVFDMNSLNLVTGEKSPYHHFLLTKGVTKVFDTRLRVVKHADGRTELIEEPRQGEQQQQQQQQQQKQSVTENEKKTKRASSSSSEKKTTGKGKAALVAAAREETLKIKEEAEKAAAAAASIAASKVKLTSVKPKKVVR